MSGTISTPCEHAQQSVTLAHQQAIIAPGNDRHLGDTDRASCPAHS
jgi:hypothetical protein